MIDDDRANDPAYEYVPVFKKYVRKLFLIDTPPTQESLDSSVGCHVPAAYVQLVLRAFESARGDAKRFMGFYDAIKGNCFGEAVLRVTTHGRDYSRTGRYSSTPVELFPVESLGCDGVHDGFVVIAPELDFLDYPFASYCPADSDGISVRGLNVQDAYDRRVTEYLNTWIPSSYFDEFWRNRLAEKLAIPEERRTQDDIADIEAARLYFNPPTDPGIQARDDEAMTIILSVIGSKETWQDRLQRLTVAANSPKRFASEDAPIPVVSSLPKGYAYLPCHDNIGTLAPEKSFRPTVEAIETIRTWNTSECLRRGTIEMEAGYPGTALHYLRCGWDYALLDLCRDEYVETLAKVYRQLDREILARVVEVMAEEN